MTIVTLSEKCETIKMLDDTIRTHHGRISLLMKNLCKLHNELEWVIYVPGSGGPEIQKEIKDLTAQIDVLTAVRNHYISFK